MKFKLALLFLMVFVSTGWGAEFLVSTQNLEIVEIFADGKLSNYATAGGKFYLIRIPGISKESVDIYQQALYDSEGSLILWRRYVWDLEGMTLDEYNNLTSGEWINLSPSSLAYIKDKL